MASFTIDFHIFSNGTKCSRVSEIIAVRRVKMGLDIKILEVGIRFHLLSPDY